ncbi:TRAP transporter permease [Aliiruegeria lutimaris]|uniref:TRAP transporter, 4TM/12TM fusion protein n=1 Tax=Aliiruegeria lutimaris TaxID=571298 RepID=A0A1G8ITM3_9RHOB|nr:TRAP transporter permease [Aliiruegeria lutimaris]SDI22269.1 TRAP transporter, 4TM/12TM fusion protein [Aliiruegeria lutimaris]
MTDKDTHQSAAHDAAYDIVAEADTGARDPGGWQARLFLGICITWSVFQLYIASRVPGMLAQFTGMSFFALLVTQARFIHLAFALTLATLAFPLRKSDHDRIPWYDWLLVALGLIATLYLVVFRLDIADRPGLWSPTDVAISAMGVVVLMIAVYRSLGLPLVVIASVFVAFTFFGGYSQWVRELTNYGGSSVSKALGHYWMQTEGVFGVALGVSTTMIFLFVLFGAVLDRAGGGNWFIKVAIALLGALRGGPAKAAVLSSMMTGLISGSSIANTVTTGTFTIPLMKRIGFPANKAGAVEVASSVNGQITPPVMGAAAFLMVEYVNIPYIDVVKHAFLPAIISYIALLYIVHLESLKLGLQGLEKQGRKLGVLLIALLFLTGFLGLGVITYAVILLRSLLDPVMAGTSLYLSVGILGVAYLALVYVAAKYPDIEVDDPEKAPVAPRLTPTMIGGSYYALPIFVLVWNLMVDTATLDRLSPALSAFWATIAMIFIAVTHRPLKAFFRGEAIGNEVIEGFGDFVQGLIAGARNMTSIGVATGAVGIIVGTISLTGAHQVIGQVIEVISGGNLMILLILVAVLSLILGMGLPTTANYIVVSQLMVPVILTVGAQSGLVVELIAVHLFVFYFGIMADVTPPVGLASFAAAAISRGDPLGTGLTAFFYSIRTALLPFLFIFNTDLLLINVGPLKAVLVFCVSLLAMLLFAAATQGYFFAKSRVWESVVLLFIAFMLFRPGYFLDQVTEKYSHVAGEAAVSAMAEQEDGAFIRLVVEGPDYDTSDPRSSTIVIPAVSGDADAALQAQGLEILPEGDQLVLEEPFFGTPFFEELANQYDFYGDTPVVISEVQIENDRMPKEIFFFPALLLLAGIVLIQRPRATQPAF